MLKKIESLQNPTVKHLVKLREDANYRKIHGSMLISGVKLVKEISKILPPKHVFTEKPYELPHILVTAEVMKKITALSSPEGIAAEFPLPAASSLEGKSPILALDNINDPGNMGNLIRTALAIGWAGIFFLPGGVDPFHEKVIRSSRGALFKLPWQAGSFEDLKKLNLTTYGADLKGIPLSNLTPEKQSCLLLSNEASGVSEKGAKLGAHVTIPMAGDMESLNVATSGAIMLYTIGRLL